MLTGSQEAELVETNGASGVTRSTTQRVVFVSCKKWQKENWQFNSRNQVSLICPFHHVLAASIFIMEDTVQQDNSSASLTPLSPSVEPVKNLTFPENNLSHRV